MIDLLKRHAIQVLRHAGHSLDEIAAQVAVGTRSVQRVIGEPMITQHDPDVARAARGIGRPSKTEAYRATVAAWLTEEPHLLRVELLRRAHLAGYAGGKSALSDLVRTVRVITPRPVVRFEGLPGAFTQHDCGEVLVRFLDGTTKRIHFFASRLEYSRWVEVTIVPNQQVETLARALVEHFAALGGIPLLAVFDRPKTVALAWGKAGEVTDWTPVFAGVVLDLGLGIEVCWPHAPQHKGPWKTWSAGSRAAASSSAASPTPRASAPSSPTGCARCTRRGRRAPTGIIPAVRRAEERPRLRPLKVAPADLALRVPVVVSASQGCQGRNGFAAAGF